ncbi:MAG: prepilin peptidase [Candidatus Omnitrophota bacterium]
MIPEKIIVFIFGSLLGSFLNVCIHRLPFGQSIVTPRSYCPKCKKAIAWYDNIPFISYLFLIGRCRHCKEKISFRYFLVELITALFFVVFYTIFGLGYNLFFYTLFICGLIIATFIDIQHRIIPDEISIGGIVAGFLLSTLVGFHIKPFSYDMRPMLNSLLGIIAGGGVIFLTGFLFDAVYFKLLKKPPIQGETTSMGGGDIKLLAMIGAFLGWQNALLTFFIAPFLGIGVAIVNLITKKDHTVPYGPFLSIAAVFVIFFGKYILSYLRI